MDSGLNWYRKFVAVLQDARKEEQEKAPRPATRKEEEKKRKGEKERRNPETQKNDPSEKNSRRSLPKT